MIHEQNPMERIAFIQEMISQTQSNFRHQSFHLLLWGAIISIGCLGHFVLLMLGYQQASSWIWVVTIPGCIVSMVYGSKKSAELHHITYADRINKWVWIGLGISAFTISTYLIPYGAIIISVLLLLGGFAAFVSGKIIQFRPLVWGSLILWLFSVITYFVNSHYSLLLMSVAIILGYLIPGYMLRTKKDLDDI